MKHILKQLVVMILVGGMLICPTLAATFPDVDEDAEYAGAVEYISNVGIMIGDDQGNFNPNKYVSRAEMATIICNLLDEKEDLSTDGSIFSDVPDSHWANKYITKAVSIGAVSGYGNGNFGPSDTVTYEQALTMIVRAMGLEEEAVVAGGFPDGYIKIACDFGYTDWITAEKGDLLTRGQVVMILYNVHSGLW